MSQLQLAYEIARAEKGVHEIGGVKHNERILAYHQATRLKAQADEVSWCSAFVNWCYVQAGLLLDRASMNYMVRERGLDLDALDNAGLGDEFAALNEVVSAREPTFSALARSWLDWGKETSDPKPGDIVVLKRGSSVWQGHVGFFVKRDLLTVTVYGGNQADEVRESRFLRVSVLGYRTES